MFASSLDVRSLSRHFGLMVLDVLHSKYTGTLRPHAMLNGYPHPNGVPRAADVPWRRGGNRLEH